MMNTMNMFKKIADIEQVDSSSIRNIISAFLFAKSNKISIQFVRYLFVGGIAYIVDFSALYIFTDIFKIHYLISAAVAFILGLITNYTLCLLIVFPSRTLKNKKLEFLLFSLIGVVGLGLNEIVIWLFTEHLSFHYLVSKIFSTIFVLLWNFLARKFLLFR